MRSCCSGLVTGASRRHRTGPRPWTRSPTRLSPGWARACRARTSGGPVSKARTFGHRAGVIGAAVGLAAAAAAAGATVERYAVGRLRLRPDARAREPFGALRGLSRAVVADDGVTLHVEEVGDPDAPLTLIFCHGFSLEMASWHYQWRDLSGRDTPGRMVFWDQRGHGRSGPSTPDHSTIEWLGKDLRRVIEVTAPDGPVIVIGHSMGGMT